MTQPPAVPPEPVPPYGPQPQWGPPPGAPYGPPPGQYVPPRSKKTKRWPWIVVGVIALLVVISAANDGLRPKRDPAAAAASSAPAELAKAPTATAKPTTTTTRATTTAPPPPPPTVYTGQGDDVLTLDRPSGLKIVKFECPACTSNTTLKSDGFESLLVNEIGAYSGLRWADIRDGGRTTTLTVGAEGAWTVTVGGIELVPAVDGVATGSGDSVVLFTGRSTKARIGNVGGGNFAVHVLSTKKDGIDLAVNTIGGYEGTVPLAGPALVQVTSDGDWSITPS